ncbi:MAG: SDR family oxidoreductase, partial [Proteobacteria bacterium]|nr:SDR family oxidoreductase [Pseudomonadota bacterium]
VLAEHLLARAPGAHVALLARDMSSAGRAERIAALGPRAVATSVDLTDGPAVEAAVAALRGRFGPVRGVVHAAGVMRDGLVARLDKVDFAAVADPKALGARHLDTATQDDPLDWFVLYSSLVGEVGNPGQAAYGYANGWLDAFAEERSGPGRSVSILWPYWADGGMTADPEAIAQARAAHGLLPLSQAAGLRAFEAALAAEESRLLVAQGDPVRLSEALEDRDGAQPPPARMAPEAMPDGVVAALIAHLRQVVAEVCGRPLDVVGAETGFESLGIDSLAVLGLTDRLERDFGTLSKTLFYQFATVRELATHLIERHGEAVAGWAGTALPSAMPVAASPAPSVAKQMMAAAPRPESDAIAIIGLAGRYPGAADLDGFWTSLAEGRDLIRDLPAERWGGAVPPAVKPGEKGGSYARWGSFLDDIDLFDPLFFRMSPREAALLDPQERLFLQTAWHLFEDAAIDPSTLRGAPCGVFVGVMWGEYQLYGPALPPGGERPSASYASIANRVSFGFDFAGPSLAVDTMCSSSLTAIHLACEAIRSGDCTMAVAGGVNLAPHPNKWVLLSQGRFAATDGRCRAFGAGGDGYVPGEGVGAVLLKPLADAQRDGDRIWGVIRGSAVNHGGRSNAYTVPNPRAQSAVIAKAMARAGVPAESISYIEAHGTGTALGDPIEVAGLATAFGEGLPAGSIALGSVKSNIGHLESAAGIAALTKVLLQMRAGEIAPSLHAEPPNPDIDFAATPFQVATRRRPWPARNGTPRRAGISGFGAGGANAHLVIEAPPLVAVAEDVPGPQVVLLSARTAPALDRLIDTYIDWLDAKPDGVRLADIGVPSQTGRQAQDERLAIVAGSLDELAKLLRTAKAGGSDPHITRGGPGAGGALRALLDGADGAAFVESLIAKRDLAKIAQLWATGYAVDWPALASGAARRIGLPLYSFDRLRCWVDAPAGIHSGDAAPSELPAPSSRPALLLPEWVPSSPPEGPA